MPVQCSHMVLILDGNAKDDDDDDDDNDDGGDGDGDHTPVLWPIKSVHRNTSPKAQ